MASATSMSSLTEEELSTVQARFGKKTLRHLKAKSVWNRKPRSAVVTLLDVVDGLAACIAPITEARWNEEALYSAIAFPTSISKEYGELGTKLFHFLP